MAKLLACKCGECTHWEVILENCSDHAAPHELGAQGALLKCKTCGEEVTVDVNPHEKLIVVEREA